MIILKTAKGSKPLITNKPISTNTFSLVHRSFSFTRTKGALVCIEKIDNSRTVTASFANEILIFDAKTCIRFKNDKKSNK